jgi:Reverse transcriptase (RNA-dependent DNA polymerase)/Phage derived protein Gp49-like (DUF891)
MGLDLMRVHFRWPVGMPLCRALGDGLWEVRSTFPSKRIARVIFCFVEEVVGRATRVYQKNSEDAGGRPRHCSRTYEGDFATLHAKAKAEPGYRFYALYDKMHCDDILAHAYAQCRSNKGTPGVDGQDFADIDAYGVQRWLGELALALREETYRPEPIRRVWIPKANGKLRPLGISTLKDRVCMTAAMLVLEAIFEADLPPEQYAYRPGRNAQQAAIEVGELLHRGFTDVVDADLSDYFGSIPHAELIKSVARRVVDGRVLHLIKMWLECAVEETDDRGRKTRTTQARDEHRGIPQGSPITPWTQKITSSLNGALRCVVRSRCLTCV